MNKYLPPGLYEQLVTLELRKSLSLLKSQKGATILHPPENFSWALEMKIRDHDGHVLRFGSDPLD